MNDRSSSTRNTQMQKKTPDRSAKNRSAGHSGADTSSTPGLVTYDLPSGT